MGVRSSDAASCRHSRGGAGSLSPALSSVLRLAFPKAGARVGIGGDDGVRHR